jgi:hypothetical protein
MDQYSPLDDGGPVQGKLPLGDDPEAERSALADLLDSSRLYHKSRDYLELLDFVARLRDYAPFNAMLLHVQKPGLTYAATARDWQIRFRRTIKEGARPLLILRPFAPVAFVYDVLDTEGPDLPADVAQAFRATGPITDAAIRRHIERLRVMGIYVERLPYGDGNAGLIRAVRPSTDRKEKPDYQVRVNATHELNVQFVTLVHELGHLFLGHLGPDAYLRIAQRAYPSHGQRELEAESLAYLVCKRRGVTSKSESYLAHYVATHTTVDALDLDTVLKAAGQVEAIFSVAAETPFGPMSKPGPKLRCEADQLDLYFSRCHQPSENE